MNRRTLLTATTLWLVGAVGCLDALPGPTTRLGWLGIDNWDPERGHRFDLRVERDGTVVHESAHTVGPAEPNQPGAGLVDCSWENVAGEYALDVRVDRGDWHVFDLSGATVRESDCVVAVVAYGTHRGVDPDDPLLLHVEDQCAAVDDWVGGCPVSD